MNKHYIGIPRGKVNPIFLICELSMPQVFFLVTGQSKITILFIKKITLDAPPQLINMLHNTPQKCPKFKVGFSPWKKLHKFAVWKSS